MLISTREAARILAPVGINRATVTRVLATGIAGEPTRAGRGQKLWVADRVRELRDREVLDKPALDQLFSWGPLIARRDIDLRLDRNRQLALLEGDWDMSWGTRGWLRAGVLKTGAFPMVATTGGFVTVGADIMDALPTAERLTRLELRPPGPWFDHLTGKRLPRGPGRPWTIHGLGPFSHEPGMTAEDLVRYLRSCGRIPERPPARGRIGP